MRDRYQWRIQEPVEQEWLDRFPELNPLVVQLLINRHLTTQEDVDRFLTPDYRQDQYDPYLFRDMKKTVDRIRQAIDGKERIVIHGDYDADGVCGSAVLYKTLQAVGAIVEVYLPHRDTEGYGLNMQTVQMLADTKTQLLITVDCGISNKPEIARATELGMDVIVTDHHSEPPELPDAAFAILNPKVSGDTYPFPYLAGVGVAFKVCQALIQVYELGEGFEKWLLDFVAISTVTDCVPLIGENRVFLKYGLIVMQKNRREGLRQLFLAMGVDPTTANAETIGFKVGPHINAAGRVKHANVALELLIEDDEQKAVERAANLVRTNTERQGLSEKMTKEALVQAEQQKDEYLIIVSSDTWPVGLVGLVAGRISSEYNRPTFVLTHMGEETVGSGRSIEHFDLVAGLQSMDELFSKYGGHPMACGFSLKNPEATEAFIERMRARARELLEGKDLRRTLLIDASLELKHVDWALVDAVQQFEPYGEGNPQALFVSERVVIEDISTVGKLQKHLRMQVSQGGSTRQCIAFGFGKTNTLQKGDVVDIVYTAGINEWNGNRSIQLNIQDIHL